MLQLAVAASVLTRGLVVLLPALCYSAPEWEMLLPADARMIWGSWAWWSVGIAPVL